MRLAEVQKCFMIGLVV